MSFDLHLKQKSKDRIKTVALIILLAIIFYYLIVVALSVFFQNMGTNDWDFGFLLILILLMPMAWQFSGIWSGDKGDRWADKLGRLLYSVVTTRRNGYEFTASLGVHLGIVAAFILIWVLLKESGFLMVGQTWRLLDKTPSTASGLAWGLPFVGAVVSTFFAMMFLTAITSCRQRIQDPWFDLIAGLSGSLEKRRKEIRADLDKMKFGLSRALQAAFLLFGTFALIKATPLGVTALGFFSDTGFFLALCATSFVAIGATALSLNLFEQLDMYLSVLKRVTSRKDDGGKLKGLFLAPWNSVPPRGLDQFAITPIVTKPTWMKLTLSVTTEEISELKTACKQNEVESHDFRYKLRELLARQIWCLRWLLILSLLSCLASVMLVYYYPVPGRDGFLTLNMSLMIVGAILFSVFTIRLERNAIASRLLCDRDESIRWSFGMLNVIALPFILIAIAATVSEVPGVREITSDFLLPALSLLGFKLF